MLAFALSLFPFNAIAQIQSYFANWESRVHQRMAKQPSWVVPLVTYPSGIYELLRVDIQSWTGAHGQVELLAKCIAAFLGRWPIHSSLVRRYKVGADGSGRTRSGCTQQPKFAGDPAEEAEIP